MKADDPAAMGSLEEDAMTGESDRARQRERLTAAQRDGRQHREMADDTEAADAIKQVACIFFFW